MKDIRSLRLYTRVARLGSFSAAAREAGLVQSQVSRLIADLEASLGVKLLSRTTRAVVPTEAGSEFLARVEPIVAAIDDAANSVRESGALQGMLRLAMPTTMGIRMVLPRLSRFAEQHPQLRIEILLEDQWQDMVREAIDVGIRVGALPDTAGTARPIASMQRVIVAAPTYLQRAGTPTTPSDLKNHRIIGGPASAPTSAWTFERGGQKESVAVRPQIVVNDNSGAVAAASGGLGITSTTSWACQQELSNGTLVRLLRDWKTADIPVNAYFPMGRATRKAARVFVDFIAVALRTDLGSLSPPVTRRRKSAK